MKGILLTIPIWLLIAWIFFYQKRLLRRGRRSPFNENILRSPAYSLRNSLIDSAFDLILYILGVLAVPFVVVALMTQYGFINLALISVGMIFVIFCFFKAARLFRLVVRLHLGVDAESTTGQELNFLMRDGAWVFHDIPYPYGNIDHVVIGTGGVFAVETKGISKPMDADRSGSENATLTVADGALVLPDGIRSKAPLEQANTHAHWLRQEIKRRFELNTPVRAVVAVPGWMVQGGFDESCWEINPKRGNTLRKAVVKSEISESEAKLIASWIEDMARSIVPKSKDFDPVHDLGRKL